MRPMTRYFRHRCKRPLIAGALLVALLFQAMIPAGFMPATDGSFALKICHSGLLTQSDTNDSNRHAGGHSHVEFCSFGALPGAGPISHLTAFLPIWQIVPQRMGELAALRPYARLERAHPARGPPALA
jgi:hypothetical protein